MGTLNDRLREWHELTNLQSVSEFPEVSASRDSEQNFLQRCKSNLKYRGAYCFQGKRVPSKNHRRRFEIDVIVLTKKLLHFIEVKNWSGEIYKSGSNWVQIRRNGEEVEHPNLTQYNSIKQEVVIDYLYKNGVNLPRSYFFQKVVFMNPNLRMDSLIANDPNVVPRYRLDQYASTQKGESFAERMLNSLIEGCLDFENSKMVVEGLFRSMPGKYLKKIRKLLHNLGTWDKVGRFGERVEIGDVLKFTINGRPVDLTSVPTGTVIKLKWTRNKILGLAKAIATSRPTGTLSLPNEKIPISTNDLLKFHRAGEEKPIELPLSHIDWIAKG